MRTDMCQVVTERPRRLSSNCYGYVRRRETRSRDLDDLPLVQGMRRPYGNYVDRKDFTDVLGPWYGYLRKQIGRKWDDVFSEICAGLSSYVARHIVEQHLNVELHVEKVDGICYEKPERYVWHSGERTRVDGLYVDPETGLLCFAERISYHREEKPDSHKDIVSRIIKGTLVVRVMGVWYGVEFKSTPAPMRVTRNYLRSWQPNRPTYPMTVDSYPEAFDVAKNRNVSGNDSDVFRDAKGNSVYVVRKWQLNSKMLKRLGLVNIAPLFKERV